MENIHGVMILIMMIMGYAIAFSYLLISMARREITYLKKDNEQALKYFKEGMERDLKRLENENNELRRDLHRIK